MRLSYVLAIVYNKSFQKFLNRLRRVKANIIILPIFRNITIFYVTVNDKNI